MEKRLEDFNLDDLFSALETNVKKDIVSFEDLVDLDRSLKRELYLGDIVLLLKDAFDFGINRMKIKIFQSKKESQLKFL